MFIFDLLVQLAVINFKVVNQSLHVLNLFHDGFHKGYQLQMLLLSRLAVLLHLRTLFPHCLIASLQNLKAILFSLNCLGENKVRSDKHISFFGHGKEFVPVGACIFYCGSMVFCLEFDWLDVRLITNCHHVHYLQRTSIMTRLFSLRASS